MRLAAAAALGLLALPALAQEEGAPLSAIDWLSQSVAPSVASSGAPLDEPPVAEDASPPGIIVTPLGGHDLGSQGVLPPEKTGLPRDLWANSDLDTLASLIGAEQAETLPALQDLVVTLMLAEAEPPRTGSARDLFLLRVDKLLDMGALEPARRLLQSGDLLDRETFRRWFDVTLLTGTEHEACAILRSQPALAPTLPARVFCLARNGDWNAAALTLNTARALGDVTPDEDLLLTRFLDADYGEETENGITPVRPSPLIYRMREAVGDLIPTAGLPLAFSHADLRDTVAWRAQIEAAERLARKGALSPDSLLAVYTARQPAASGGVWDRAAAIQRLERAISSGDQAILAEALPTAWTAMEEVGLQVPFAELYGRTLADLPLEGQVAALAHRIALLSGGFEAAARSLDPASPREALWQAVATGEADGARALDAASAAVIEGFLDPEIPAELRAAIEERRLGEAVLRAVALFHQGLDGDHGAVTDAIATLRIVGLEDVARRAALQFLLLGDER